MGSDLYDVTVMGVKDKTVKLAVDVIHPDAGPALADKSFALMMLWDTADDDDPIQKEISLDDALDAKWMKKYANGFVASVKGSKKALDVVVTDAAWLKHLKEGKSYSSRAYKNASAYDKCAPILFAKPKSAASQDIADDEDAFIWVPRAVFATYVTDVPDCPEVLQIPAYGDKAYAVVEAAKGDLKKALSWSGRAIQGTRACGALVIDKNKFGKILMYSDGSRGCGGIDLAAVGLVGLKKGARTKTKLSYEGVLRSMPGLVVGCEVRGDTVKFFLEHGPKSASVIQSATDVLWILARALPGYDLYSLEGSQPLAKALVADSQRAGDPSQWQTHLPALVTKYVAKYELEMPTAKPTPKLDKMKSAAVKEFFLGSPFGKSTLVVRVTDPKWLAHLKPNCRYPLPGWTLEKPKAPIEPVKYPPTKAATVDWERLGIRFDDALVIREIREGSAAAKANLKVGYTLAEVNTKSVETPKAMRKALMDAVEGGAPSVLLAVRTTAYSTSGYVIALRRE